jgi:hypothetical protein
MRLASADPGAAAILGEVLKNASLSEYQVGAGKGQPACLRDTCSMIALADSDVLRGFTRMPMWAPRSKTRISEIGGLTFVSHVQLSNLLQH